MPRAADRRVVELHGGAVRTALDFLAVQGPHGFAAGMLLEGTGERGEGGDDRVAPVALGLVGEGGALVAVVARRGDHAIVCAPLADVWDDVLRAVGELRPRLRRLDLPLPLHDRLVELHPGVLAGAHGYTVWLTRLGRLRVPTRPVPTVRRARIGDAPAVQAIYAHVCWMRDDDLDRWRRRLRLGRSWVAEMEGRPVAVARWTGCWDGTVEVGGVACEPGARRRGAATAVVIAAIDHARRAGRTVLLSYGDPELGALYHGLGFEHVGRHRWLSWPPGD
ncbi:MAG TPA: GNAT family N-acetyltransferase [Verrucomicrobiae bacterium]|nr:GNAT family N-acetyltransferase [Verrucomicrobiae bacterium]